MIGKGLLRLFIIFLFLSSVTAEEPFRVFKTPQGASFEGRAVGYENDVFYLENKAGKFVKVPLSLLSSDDQAYLQSSARLKRIPEGNPVSNQKKESGTTTPPSSTVAKSGVDFHSEIAPILEAKCNECHKAPYEKNGRTVKPKAGLRFDTFELLMKGNEDGPVIIAGNVPGSILIEVIGLPPDDDMIMPPKGEPLSKSQIDLFKRWVMEGASEKPTGKVVEVSSSASESTEEPEAVIHRPGPQKKRLFAQVLFSPTFQCL